MNDKIKEIIESALKDYAIEKIILFGSRARGVYSEDSDYDILISVKENLTYLKRRELTHKLLEKLADAYIAADVIIRSSEYVEIAQNEIGNVINYAIKEGVTL